MSVADGSSLQPVPVEHVYFAVMGVTGSGKSTFVRDCSKIDVKVGHGLVSCTTRAEDFAFDYADGLRIHLIDTPGFDDTNKSDTDVLKDIANWLAQSYKREERLSGILFLHSISANRLTGGAIRNLAMFKKLCGEQCFRSVVLATTHWDEVDVSVGESREDQLKTTPGMWQDMIEEGSQYMRHDRQEQSVLEILKHMIQNRSSFTAAIQQEMVEDGASLLTTQAGQQLSADLLAAEERHIEQLKDIQNSYEEAQRSRDAGAQEKFERLRKETQSQLDGEKRARSDLKATLDTIKREKQEETRRSQQETARQLAEINRMRMSHRQDKQEMEGQIKNLQVQLESLGRKNAAQAGDDDYDFEKWLKMGLGVLGNLFRAVSRSADSDKEEDFS